jgi:hypothetical protein
MARGDQLTVVLESFGVPRVAVRIRAASASAAIRGLSVWCGLVVAPPAAIAAACARIAGTVGASAALRVAASTCIGAAAPAGLTAVRVSVTVSGSVAASGLAVATASLTAVRCSARLSLPGIRRPSLARGRSASTLCLHIDRHSCRNQRKSTNEARRYRRPAHGRPILSAK